MDKIEVQLPAVVNNVVITKNMIDSIDTLQTGGSFTWPYEKREHDEVVLNDHLDHCKTVMMYIVGIISDQQQHDNTKEINLLCRLYWLHDTLEEFKTPPELFVKSTTKKRRE